MTVEGFFFSKSFLSDMANLLKPDNLADAANPLSGLLGPENFSLKMIRELIILIFLFLIIILDIFLG